MRGRLLVTIFKTRARNIGTTHLIHFQTRFRKLIFSLIILSADFYITNRYLPRTLKTNEFICVY